jgi:hypothetical protein
MRSTKPTKISPLEEELLKEQEILSQALVDDFRLTAADEAPKRKYSLWRKVVGGISIIAMYAMTAFGAGAALPSCDNGNNVDNTPVSVSGSATDGPYVNGSEVTIVELTKALAPTTNTIIQWTDDLGRYSAKLSNNTNYVGSVDGFNFDEITGRPSEAPINLRGYWKTGMAPGAQYNINDVTHLIAERVKFLVDSGTPFEDADNQALNELLAELDMIISTPLCHAYEMDIVSGANDCDNFLLAVEILVRRYAHSRAEETGDPVDATLQDVVNSASLYFKNTGTMSDEFKNGLREAAMSIDIIQATQNLTDYFTARGLGIVPDADAVIDSDLDGEVNATDCLPRDATRWTGHADVDEDGHDYIACGGDDCDDACPTCYPGAAESCGEARDHDCDGLVDDMEGCGVCTVGTPFEIGNLSFDNSGTSLSVVGDYAFVSDQNGFRIVDLSTPSLPALINSLSTGPQGRSTVMRNEVFISSADGFTVLDVTDPLSPVVAAGPTGIDAYPISSISPSITSNIIYVASNQGLRAIDVEDISSLDVLATDTSFINGSIFSNADLIYMANPEGFYILQYAPDSGIQVISQIAGLASNDVRVTQGRAYVATPNGLSVVDVSSPAAPSAIGEIPLDEAVKQLFVAGQRAFAISDSQFYVIDVSVPEAPSLQSTTSLTSTVSNALFVSEGNAYVLATSSEGNALYSFDLDCQD